MTNWIDIAALHDIPAQGARLIRTPRNARDGEGTVSSCYPLAVHNLIARAMNAAYDAGYPKVDANVIKSC